MKKKKTPEDHKVIISTQEYYIVILLVLGFITYGWFHWLPAIIFWLMAWILIETL